ncbi:MAG: ATP-dependent helicase HrpB [Verrucomicrobiota bacterium]
MDPRQLPVWSLHAPVLDAVRTHGRLVLVAATGSGKTTQVPQMLLDAGLAGERRIVVLQPRRVAARSVSARVAWERGSKLGGEVGYQVRFEDHLGPQSRLCFVTEGILLRWLQDDPELSDVGLVVFDEFHERNLLSDVALALVKQLRRTSRPDLGIVVMSATLEAEPVARYLADAVPDGADATPAPVLVSEGRTFPVEVRWADYNDARPEWEQAASAVEAIIQNGWEGDVLVFMPGMAEIQSTLRSIAAARLGERVELMALHGDLPPDEQDRAFQPSPIRKVVVSTNVAETSVTIDGVRHVVDSGLARVARYDAERGIQTLLVEDISRASAEQRAGRAGRTSAGTCWRLWTESGHLNRPDRNTPEIRRSDLAEVVLLLHSLGVRRAVDFDWLDKPDPAAVERAEDLLVTLGALGKAGDGVGSLTEIGRRMLRMPMHPRFARMLVEAGRRRCVHAAAMCAALVSGRDLLQRIGRDDAHLRERREVFEATGASDFHTLLRAQQFARNASFSPDACRRSGIHAATARQVEDTYRQLVQVAQREGLVPRDDTKADAPSGPADPEALERCIVAGFVDQLCQRRNMGSLECQVAGGREATLARESVVQDASLFVAASIREVSGRTGCLTLLSQCTAARVEWLREMFPQHAEARLEHVYDRHHKRVAAIEMERFLGLVIDQRHQRDVDPVASGSALADAFTRGWLDLPNLDHRAQQWVARVECLRAAVPELELPSMRGEGLLVALRKSFHGLTLGREAQQVDLLPPFRSVLSPAQQAFVDELAPASVTVAVPGQQPRPWKLSYATDKDDPDAPPVPEIQVKITDILALKEHPRVAEGRVAVCIWVMDPGGKRLGSTRDWPAWRATEYVRMRHALRAKNPGFVWT